MPPASRLPGGRPGRLRALLLALALLAGAFTGLLAAGSATPARAALPDAWGYGWRDTPDAIGASLHDSLTSASTAGSVIGFTAPNHYTVKFPGVGRPQGVVHVTAVSQPVNVPSYCSPDKWFQAGTDEIVQLSCFVVSGGGSAPFQTGFSVTFAASTPPVPAGPDYGYIHFDGASTIISQFTQSGGLPTVNHLTTGVYQVKWPGLGMAGTPQGGSFQATGLTLPGGAPARCKTSDWNTFTAAQVVNVRCFDGVGVPVDDQWNLSYQGQRDITGRANPKFGYFWQTGGAPPRTDYNSTLLFGANTSGPVGAASILVKMPAIGFTGPSTTQVTAYGPGPQFCRMSDAGSPPWSNAGGTEVIWSVDCFAGSGAPLMNDFTATWASQ